MHHRCVHLTTTDVRDVRAPGLDDPDLLKDRTEVAVGPTPYGEASDVLVTGTISGVPCVLLARHGRK